MHPSLWCDDGIGKKEDKEYELWVHTSCIRTRYCIQSIEKELSQPKQYSGLVQMAIFHRKFVIFDDDIIMWEHHFCLDLLAPCVSGFPFRHQQITRIQGSKTNCVFLSLLPQHKIIQKTMVVRIRLQRFGRHDRPFYRIVAADARAKRDGRFLEMVSQIKGHGSSSSQESSSSFNASIYWYPLSSSSSCSSFLPIKSLVVTTP